MKRITRGLSCAVAIALVLGLVSRSVPARAQSAVPDALSFFKNYFVTGDYAVGGVGLEGSGSQGLASGDIVISDVPAGADILAAFLYWQVVTTDTLGPDSGSAGATFNGWPLENPEGPIAKVLGEYGTAPCWSSGGGTGKSGGTKRTYGYRADVLRFLNFDAATGKPDFSQPMPIQLPDSGSGNGTPKALGASLVVVYRDSSKPLSAVVIYDGSYTIDNSTQSLSQTIKGFYQTADASHAKITYIAGAGQSNKHENVYFGAGLAAPSLIASDPFSSAAGSSWDNPTFSELAVPADTADVTTVVDTAGLSGSDCLTWGAIIFKTDVKDSDNDGLLDVWETNTTFGSLVDPNGRPLPPLADMGALPNRKDLFVELGYMTTNGAALSYDKWVVDPASGQGQAVPGPQPAHTHQPPADALQMMADAFWKGPQQIAVHFDIGPITDPASPYKAGEFTGGQPTALTGAVGYIVPPAVARGGESLDEMDTVCARDAVDPPWYCQFSGNPGTVGWKTGFRYIRDEILGGAPAPAADEEDVCETPSSPYFAKDGLDAMGNDCERRFDRVRKDMFHYVFFAHALGLPRAVMPCLDSAGNPSPVDPETLLCQIGETENPEFRIPKTTSGVGDFPGGDVLVSLGGFKDVNGAPTGTPFMQASTMMHELGHNFERRHSGTASTLEVPEPNCKPTYLSVMNYLYQLRGLLDDQGRPHLNYSAGTQQTLDERYLNDVSMLSPYRLGWYAPLAGSYLEGHRTPALRHCNGSFITPGEPAMIRIDARYADTQIDWNANGVVDLAQTLDINFNGRTTVFAGPGGGDDPAGDGEVLRDADDWSNLGLNQIGSRRSVGGFFTDELGVLRFGAVSLDMGRVDFGRVDFGRVDFGRVDFGRVDFGRVDFGAGDLGLGDFGRVDFGRVDFGRVDFGRVDFGRVDFGRVDFGAGDLGLGDFGGGDIFQGDPNNAGGELDAETAGDLAKTPPNEFTACVINGADCTAPSGAAASNHDVVATFTSPNIGGVTSYVVYRVAGANLLPGQTWEAVSGSVTPLPGGAGAYYVIDASDLTNGGQYTYFAVAVYEDGVQSDPSNLVTITAVNDPPAVPAIPDQTIYMNDTAGPIAFTITDEHAGTVTLGGSSSNTTLVPNVFDPVTSAGISFGGTNGSRTVTVTPALNQLGTATITVTATDAGGNSASTSFLLTVLPRNYEFTGFFSPMSPAGTLAAPTDSGTSNYGNAIPLKWRLALSGLVVSDLTSLKELKAVPGTGSGTTCAAAAGLPTLYLLEPATGKPTGNSTFRFDVPNQQFIFNWDTSAADPSSCYTIVLTPNDADGIARPRATIVRFR